MSNIEYLLIFFDTHFDYISWMNSIILMCLGGHYASLEPMSLQAAVFLNKQPPKLCKSVL